MEIPTETVTSDNLASRDVATPETLYLDLMKKCLTRLLFIEANASKSGKEPRGNKELSPYTLVMKVLYPTYVALVRRMPFIYTSLQRALVPVQHAIKRHAPVDPTALIEGRGWPGDAETMIGLQRLNNIQFCVTDVLQRGVPGDLIETGAWRGGATIFMKAVLKAYGDTERIVWVADSFQGLPKPDEQRFPADAGETSWAFGGVFAASYEQVKANFARYGLLDERVRFLVGWFRDTLPSAPIDRLAILRLDGDLYESTMDALNALYPKLSIGGYLIVDDYNAFSACSAAVQDYRAQHGIAEEIVPIDWTGVYWQRLR